MTNPRTAEGSARSVGAPNVRNLAVSGLSFGLFAVLQIGAGGLWAASAPERMLTFAAGITPLISVGRLSVEVQPGRVVSRAWWQIAARRRGQVIEFVPGDVALRTPAGRWILNGKWAPFGGLLPWEGVSLRRCLTAAGIEIEDQAAAWRRDHPIRAALRYAPVALLPAYLVTNPWLSSWLGLIFLVGVLCACVVAFYLSAAPNEYEIEPEVES